MRLNLPGDRKLKPSIFDEMTYNGKIYVLLVGIITYLMCGV